MAYAWSLTKTRNVAKIGHILLFPLLFVVIMFSTRKELRSCSQNENLTTEAQSAQSGQKDIMTLLPTMLSIAQMPLIALNLF